MTKVDQKQRLDDFLSMYKSMRKGYEKVAIKCVSVIA